MNAAVASPRVLGSQAWALPGAVTAALLSGVVYTFVRDPHQPGMFPSCVFLSASGFYCPGCGGLRAAHDLMHGDVASAIQMNAVAVFAIFPAIAIGWAWWIAALAFPRVPRVTIPTWLAIAVPVALGVFWVMRNIPALEPWLAP